MASINDLEAVTNYDFLSNIPKNIQEVIENNSDLSTLPEINSTHLLASSQSNTTSFNSFKSIHNSTQICEGTVIDKGESIPLRQEIIRDSQNKFTATYFIPDDNDNWQPVVDETCDRSLNSI